MTDKAKDFMNEIYIRVKNPLIFSFAVSWMLTNWRIIFALFSYSLDDYTKLGYKSFVEYATFNSSNWRAWILPLICAVLYTLGLPILRGIINVYNAEVSKRSFKKELKANGNSSVSFAKHYRIQQEYIDKTKELEELFKEELNIKTENLRLNTLINETENQKIGLLRQKEIEKNEILSQINSLSKENESLKLSLSSTKERESLFKLDFDHLHQSLDIKWLNGRWLIRDSGATVGGDEIKIEDGFITFREDELSYKISLFRLTQDVKFLAVKTNPMTLEAAFLYYNLKMKNGDKTFLVGEVNERKIEMIFVAVH
jgi:hypothetical protein